MMEKWFSISVLALLLMMPFFLNGSYGSDALSGNTYYVAPWGDDSNPGTFDMPWKSIQHAADVMNAGDTVYIRGGTYHESVYTTRSGSDGNYIRFRAYEEETPVIDGNGVASGTGFTITHSYIKISGIKICNWSDTGIWVAHASHIYISNCEVCYVTFGIGMADGTHDFELNNVDIHHFDLYGFDASPSGGDPCYNGVLNDCVAHNGRDASQNVDGFALGHGEQHDFVFNRCTTYDVFDGFDISARDTILSRCSAHGCWNGGYKIWQDNVKLINCLSYHNTISNVELDWDGNAGTVRLQNCNFVDAGVYNIWVENSQDTLYMYNCILAGGDNIGLAFEQRDASNYHGDYNIFHNDGARAIAVGYTDEFSMEDIHQGRWASYSGQDIHSLVCFNPSDMFQNMNGWNFHLKEGCMAIDNGTSSNAPSVDYDGNPRPQGAGYDIGAYEYPSGVNHAPLAPEKPESDASIFYQDTLYKFSSSTTDPDGDDVYYLFDWGDGSTSGWLGPYKSGESVQAEHSWGEEGDYSIKVKARDTLKLESQWSEPLPIHVNYRAKFEVDGNGPYYGKENKPVHFHANASNGTMPIKWEWDFGDEETSYERNATHIYSSEGTYNITLHATDAEGRNAYYYTYAIISPRQNHAPEKPTISTNYIPPQGWFGKAYEFRASSVDGDGDTIYFKFDWGDGSTSEWLGPYENSSECVVEHTWKSDTPYKRETFVVSVVAMDDPNGDGNVSDGMMSEEAEMKVAMPLMPSFQQFITMLIEKVVDAFITLKMLLASWLYT